MSLYSTLSVVLWMNILLRFTLLLTSGKCPYVTCDISDWNTWQGELPEDGCAQQMRTKNVTKKHHEKIQAESCEGLQTGCPTAPSETRQWCKKTIDFSFLRRCINTTPDQNEAQLRTTLFAFLQT